MRKLYFLAAVALCLFTGCAAGPDAVEATEALKTQAPEASQVPGDGDESGDDGQTADDALMENETVGGLRIGLSADETVALLGEPSTGEWVESPVDGWEHQAWSYDDGIELDMRRDADGSILVNAITITAPCSFKTSRGIGIGEAYDTVYEAYKAEIDPSNIQSDHASLIAGSVYGGVVFMFENEAAVEIFIGAAAE